MTNLGKSLCVFTLTLAAAAPAMAAMDEHNACDADTTIQVGDMGAVNEATLQRHIEDLNSELHRVNVIRSARTLRLSYKREIREHLDEMQDAMDQLHTVMYNNGCEAALHGMSVTARLDAMEKRLAEQK